MLIIEKKRLLVILFAVLMVPFFVFSTANADIEGQSQTFNTNQTFDKFGRKSVTATLRHIGANAYFYIEDSYWNVLSFSERENFLNGIRKLSGEFDDNIYPKETSFWGQEPKPGVDDDNRIFILLEQLKQGNGGYFSTSNGYPRSITTESNEKEMLVLSAESIIGPYAKTFMAHEFQHLISFNKKDLTNKLSEDVWLNELRSEYSITLTGYNDFFTDSNLERRADNFFNNPSDSLTEWPNVSADYALVALLAEYISDKYGPDLLKDTLGSNLTGISSINSALAIRNVSERFIDIFANWLAASYINDDLMNPKFGYTKPGLKRYRASPQRLTVISDSGSNIFDYYLKPWQLYGHKILTSGALSNDRVLKLSPSFNSKFAYADNLGRFSIIDNAFYVNNPGGLEYFFIFPVNSKKISDFGSREDESTLSLTVNFEDKSLGMDFGSALKNGALIKKARESETYVIEGKYRRYLRPEIISLYGHLIAAKAVEVDDATFNSYTTTNYVRYVDDEKVYAVWPDGTKHWLNITPQQWDASGRDWGAIFIINDLELDAYKVGVNITK